jgi:hypothetical protein
MNSMHAYVTSIYIYACIYVYINLIHAYLPTHTYIHTYIQVNASGFILLIVLIGFTIGFDRGKRYAEQRVPRLYRHVIQAFLSEVCVYANT